MQPAPDEVGAYGAEATRRLRTILASRLLGVYLGGGYALSDWEPATSDVDLLVVVDGRIADGDADAIIAALHFEALPAPGRRLELTVVTHEEIRVARRHPRLELNVDTGPGQLEVHRSTVRPDGHWLPLDLEVARRRGVPLLGPPPNELIAARPAAWLREAQLAALAWYARSEPNSHQRVLNACRAWAYAVEGQLLGKGAAAAWALARGADRALIEEALRIRRGAPPTPLPEREIRGLAERARNALEG
jgi:predicted nucleotidyltransferase